MWVVEAAHSFFNCFRKLSTKFRSYTLPISRDVLERAEKALAERQAAEHTQPRKPPLRDQLTAAKEALAEKPAAQQR